MDWQGSRHYLYVNVKHCIKKIGVGGGQTYVSLPMPTPSGYATVYKSLRILEIKIGRPK